MNYKKKSIVFFVTIICLLISIVFIAYRYVGGGSKEIKAAKKFIAMLYSEDIVSESEELDKIVYESSKKNDINNESEYYIVNTRDFGIDVDNEYRVIGFKNKVSTLGQTKVSEEESIAIAEKFLDKIYKGDVKFKNFIVPETKDIPYYSLSFSKFEDGYQFYNDEIIINIDKEKGKLDGYSNISKLKDTKRVKINISEKEAENIALKKLEDLSGNSEILDKTFMAFYESKDKKETELCYVVSMISDGNDMKDTKWKYFVSTESGEIINIIKDTVSETKALK